jgi:hypothetical protein
MSPDRKGSWHDPANTLFLLSRHSVLVVLLSSDRIFTSGFTYNRGSCPKRLLKLTVALASNCFRNVEHCLGILVQSGVERINHYTPLHYLPFIGRSKALLSKPSLEKLGYAKNHLRSMSSRSDVARGFGRYAFLTIDQTPRILKAKLAAGFPHIAISVPAEAIEQTTFSLCRFNVAMTRYLRRDGKPGFPESSSNGRYYGTHQIPIAKTEADKASMLDVHLNAGTMIEVLIDGDLALPDETRIITFCEADLVVAKKITKRLGLVWRVSRAPPPGSYPLNKTYRRSVDDFIKHALDNAEWRGDGLEFDRV